MKNGVRRIHRAPKHNARVLIGGACWDYYLAVHCLRPGIQHHVQHRLSVPGGGALNNAIVHRALAPHAPIVLLAAVGDDAEGRALRRHLAGRRIKLYWPPVQGVSTSVSYVVVEGESGRGTILAETGARATALPLTLAERALEHAVACCLVAPTNNEQIPAVLRIAAQRHVPVYFGLGRTQIDTLGYEGLRAALVDNVAVLMCNRLEAERLTNQSAIADQLDALHFDGQVEMVVITDGADGIHASRDGELFYEPAYTDPQRPIVDDVGAGDGAQAALVDALLRGRPLEVALRAAARQGFEVCTGRGATTCLVHGATMEAYLASGAQLRADERARVGVA